MTYDHGTDDYTNEKKYSDRRGKKHGWIYVTGGVLIALAAASFVMLEVNSTAVASADNGQTVVAGSETTASSGTNSAIPDFTDMTYTEALETALDNNLTLVVDSFKTSEDAKSAVIDSQEETGTEVHVTLTTPVMSDNDFQLARHNDSEAFVDKSYDNDQLTGVYTYTSSGEPVQGETYEYSGDTLSHVKVIEPAEGETFADGEMTYEKTIADDGSSNTIQYSDGAKIAELATAADKSSDLKEYKTDGTLLREVQKTADGVVSMEADYLNDGSLLREAHYYSADAFTSYQVGTASAASLTDLVEIAATFDDSASFAAGDQAIGEDSQNVLTGDTLSQAEGAGVLQFTDCSGDQLAFRFNADGVLTDAAVIGSSGTRMSDTFNADGTPSDSDIYRSDQSYLNISYSADSASSDGSSYDENEMVVLNFTESDGSVSDSVIYDVVSSAQDDDSVAIDVSYIRGLLSSDGYYAEDGDEVSAREWQLDIISEINAYGPDATFTLNGEDADMNTLAQAASIFFCDGFDGATGEEQGDQIDFSNDENASVSSSSSDDEDTSSTTTTTNSGTSSNTSTTNSGTSSNTSTSTDTTTDTTTDTSTNDSTTTTDDTSGSTTDSSTTDSSSEPASDYVTY